MGIQIDGCDSFGRIAIDVFPNAVIFGGRPAGRCRRYGGEKLRHDGGIVGEGGVYGGGEEEREDETESYSGERS